MSFGERFGKLVRAKRAIEGLTQEDLAALVYDNEASKTRVSELENGKAKKPQAKTIDAYVVALNISMEELDNILSDAPHPKYVGNLVDFFDMGGKDSVDIEVATNTTGKAVMFHNRHLGVRIKRVEYFVEEAMYILVQEGGVHRRPAGLPLNPSVSDNLTRCSEITFVYLDDETRDTIEGQKYDLKIIY